MRRSLSPDFLKAQRNFSPGPAFEGSNMLGSLEHVEKLFFRKPTYILVVIWI